MNHFKFTILRLAVLSMLPVVFMIVTSKGQDADRKPAGKIKVITIINGDTTITESNYPQWTEEERAEFHKKMKDLPMHPGMKFRHFEHMDSLHGLFEREILIDGPEGINERTRIMLHDKDIEVSPDGKQRIIIKHCIPGDSLRRQLRMLDENGKLMELPPMPEMPVMPGLPPMPPMPPLPPMPDVEKLLKERGALINEKEGQVFIFEDEDGNGKRNVMIRVIEPEKAEFKRIAPAGRKEKAAPKNTLEVDNLKVYPNPSNGQFNLAFSTKEKGDTQVRILDVNGKEVYSEMLKDFSGTYHHAFDLADATSGTYFVSVEQNGKRTLKKIVKEG